MDERFFAGQLAKVALLSTHARRRPKTTLAPLNKPSRSLRSTLQALTAALTEAILAAARESLLELAEPRRLATARKQRARVERPLPKRAKSVRARRERGVERATAEAASDLLITDPQALLAAIETAAPATSSESPHGHSHEAPEEREEPKILAPGAAPAREPAFVLALRAGEEIMRTSGSGVVLRRRRM
jgi:hypothetical protein